MADYQESAVAGTFWHRFNQIHIDNTRNAIPVVTMHEERVVALADGRELREPVGVLELPCGDLSYPITLRDPASGEPTGDTVTLSEVYAIVHSLCLQEALIRDGAIPRPGVSDNPLGGDTPVIEE